MKLARKLASLLLLGIMGILVVALIATVRRELRLFDTDMRRDHRVLGQALAVAAAQTWTLRGERSAEQLIDRVNLEEGTVRTRLVRFSGDGEPRGQRLTREEVVQSEVAVPGRYPSLMTWVRVPVGELVAVEISESTEDRQTYLRSTILRTIVTALGITLVCGAIAITVGILVVGRRVDALARGARQIGTGDTSVRIAVRGHDELTELAQAMNGMAEHLEGIQTSLRQASEARVRALEQLRHADRLATVGKLASGIAHELGTPLNVVGGRAKMILRDAEVHPPVAKNARIIAEQSERMTVIIRQLLDFARSGESRKQPSDLGHLLEQSAHLLLPLARKKSIEIVTELPPSPLVLDVDQSQIHQVLTNLIVNGIQAMDKPGTVTVRLTRRQETDGTATEPPRAVASISVRDQGPGIPEEVAAHVFEPFFTTKGVGEGTGLGLSVAWGMVEEHGGRIQLRTPQEGGAEFVVELPIPRT
jgi:two-component system, NtrC family, sensor kinase